MSRGHSARFSSANQHLTFSNPRQQYDTIRSIGAINRLNDANQHGPVLSHFAGGGVATERKKYWSDFYKNSGSPESLYSPALDIYNKAESLPEELQEAYLRPLWTNESQKKDGSQLLGYFLKKQGGPGMNYDKWKELQEEQGLDSSEHAYRVLTATGLRNLHEANEKYKGIGGFFKGAADAWKEGVPAAIAQVANVVGKVLPGANVVTDQIEHATNPDGEPLALDMIGGPLGMIANGAVGVAGHVVGGKIRKPRKAAQKRRLAIIL